MNTIALATEVASELSKLRGENWAMEPSTGGYAEHLVVTPGHARLAVELYDGRAYVAGQYPGSTTGQTFKITVGASRGAATIAREIDRRILGAGYADQLLLAVERRAAMDARAERKAELMAKAGAPFREAVHADGKVYLGKYLRGSGYVEPYYNLDDGPALSFDLSGIPEETALKMLKVLADSFEAQARCCHTYGPHHDARVSLIGCVRGRHTELPKPHSAEESALYDVYYRLSQNGPQPGSWDTWLAQGLETAPTGDDPGPAPCRGCEPQCTLRAACDRARDELHREMEGTPETAPGTIAAHGETYVRKPF